MNEIVKEFTGQLAGQKRACQIQKVKKLLFSGVGMNPKIRTCFRFTARLRETIEKKLIEVFYLANLDTGSRNYGEKLRGLHCFAFLRSKSYKS